MRLWSWCWWPLLALFPLGLNAQADFLRSLDQAGLPDTAIIDRINDHAWELSRSQPDSAQLLADSAIARSNKANNYARGLINARIILGVLHKNRGFYSLSVQNYLEAMHQAERSGDSLRVSGCLNNIGSVFFEQENYRKALHYYQRSLAIEQRLGKDKEQRSIRLVNIGDAYLQLDSLDKASAYYYNSLLIEEELQSQDGMFYARMGIGKVDTRKGNYANARLELDRALGYARTLGNLTGICEAQTALGELALAQDDHARALALLDSARNLAQDKGFQGLQLQALDDLYQVYKAQGRYDLAIAALEQYHAMKDLINNAMVNSRIGELEMQYELGKKEQQLALSRKADELREAQLQYERKLRYYLLFTLLLAAALITYKLWQRNKANGS